MKREILFRGKVLDNAEFRASEWIQGIFIPHSDKYGYMILPYADNSGEYIKDYFHPVDLETVGEFTGLVDKHGNKIFEGDIVECSWGGLGFVEYGHESCSCCEQVFGWGLTDKHGYVVSWGIDVKGEVIGNLTDNPELLKEGV